MLEWINSLFSGLDLVFFIMALLGGLLFITRMALAMFGFGHHDVSGVDMDHGGGMGDASDSSGAGDTDASFKVLNLQGLTVFFLMFGLVGLAMHRGSGFGEVASVFGGFAAGLVMMTALAKLVQMMFRLQTSGNLDVSHAVGHTGTVYLGIPAGGTGQIQLSFDGRMRIFDAVAEDKKAIKTGDRVQIAQVLEGRIMVVKKV